MAPPGAGAGAPRSLAPFFEPRTVAVIGASRDPGKVGGSILDNLRSAGFEGRVVPVNARARTVQGLLAAPSLLAVEGDVDLAVVAVPAPQVLSALKDCVARGVGGAVIISAGFRETDAEGQAREAELRAWLAGQPLRVVGPNCLGWIRPARRLNLTFAPGMPLAGGIAFISHSGALAVSILDWSRDRRTGFSLFASLGNQADVTETDVLDAVADDPETRVIVAYLEGVDDGRRFFETLRRVAARKPVVVLKVGRSAEGARAISSHTGALAGSDVAFEAAIRQAGAVRVRTIEELFELARALDAQPAPGGRRLLVVTNGGGLGVVATDAAREAGMDVTALDEEVRGRLRAVLPATASVGNPIDLVGDADAARFQRALEVLRERPPGDALLVLLTAQAATDAATVARAIVGATRGFAGPVVTSFVGGARVAPGVAVVEEARVPCYPFPERAVMALSGMATLAERRARLAAREPVAAPPPERGRHALRMLAAQGTSGVLGILRLAPVLDAYGIRVAAVHLAATPEEAAGLAPLVGFPLALKIVSPDIAHKTDVGGVRLGLRSRAEVAEAAGSVLERAAAACPSARIEGVLLQPMVPPGTEMLVGVVRDPQFGPVVVAGFGGIYVEVLKDTVARLAPVSPDEALWMLSELRMAPALLGVRGQPPVDRAALALAISRLAQLAMDAPGLAEIELNPLVVGPDGVIAVDARATVTTKTS
jgi:acetyltransferase